MTTIQYLNRYYKDKDINVEIIDDNTIKTYRSMKDCWDEPRETVDTYKLICNANRKYKIIRSNESRPYRRNLIT